MIQVNYIHINLVMLQYPFYVVPHIGFAASNTVADVEINARLKTKYHMNLSESIGFFGE
jgi:hypothetical protein